MDANQFQPLYYQIVQDIKRQIDEKVFLPGEKLPNERWFEEHYGVSRVTVRRALEEMVAMGIVEDRQKRGKYVKSVGDMGVDAFTGRMHSVHHMLESKGIKSRRKILQYCTEEASPELAEIFNVPQGHPLIKLESLRYADNKPYALTMGYFNANYLPEFFNAWELIERSLYDVLEEAIGEEIFRQEQTLEAIEPTQECRELLELPDDCRAILLIKGKMLTKDQRVIEYAETQYQTSDVPYSFDWTKHS